MKNFRLNHNELLQSLGLPTSSTEDLFGNPGMHVEQNLVMNPNSKGELLLCMTIDLGEGNKDILNVYSNDDPKELARHFCIKNHLNLEAVEILKDSIIDNLHSNEEREQFNYTKNLLNENRQNLFDTKDFYKNLRKKDPAIYKNDESKERMKKENNKGDIYVRLYSQNVVKTQFFKKII